MDKGIVEGGEDTSHAEDELTCSNDVSDGRWYRFPDCVSIPVRNLLTFANLRTERNVLSRCALDFLFWRHVGTLIGFKK